MQKLFLYCHYHVLCSLQIELFLQGQLHYNVFLCQNGFHQFFLCVLNLERPWLHMKKLFHREIECYAFLFFIPLKCHFMILCILQNVYTIIVDHKIQMYISFYLGVVPKVMSVALIEPFDRWFLSLSKDSGTTCRRAQEPLVKMNITINEMFSTQLNDRRTYFSGNQINFKQKQTFIWL